MKFHPPFSLDEQAELVEALNNIPFCDLYSHTLKLDDGSYILTANNVDVDDDGRAANRGRSVLEGTATIEDDEEAHCLANAITVLLNHGHRLYARHEALAAALAEWRLYVESAGLEPPSHLQERYQRTLAALGIRELGELVDRQGACPTKAGE